MTRRPANADGAVKRARALLDDDAKTINERKREGIQAVLDLDADGSDEAREVKIEIGRRIFGLGGPDDDGRMWA